MSPCCAPEGGDGRLVACVSLPVCRAPGRRRSLAAATSRRRRAGPGLRSPRHSILERNETRTDAGPVMFGPERTGAAAGRGDRSRRQVAATSRRRRGGTRSSTSQRQRGRARRQVAATPRRRHGGADLETLRGETRTAAGRPRRRRIQRLGRAARRVAPRPAAASRDPASASSIICMLEIYSLKEATGITAGGRNGGEERGQGHEEVEDEDRKRGRGGLHVPPSTLRADALPDGVGPEQQRPLPRVRLRGRVQHALLSARRDVALLVGIAVRIVDARRERGHARGTIVVPGWRARVSLRSFSRVVSGGR